MVWTRLTSRRGQVIVDVDTQNHFFLNEGPLCVNDHRCVLDNIQKVLTWGRDRQVHMISTIQIGSGNPVYAASFLSGGLSIRKPACTLCRRHILLKAMDSTDLPRRLVEQYDQVILQKRCFDPFVEPQSDRLFTELQADDFIVVGTPTEGAVKATTLGLLARHKHVTVVVDATGSLSSRLAKKALLQMKAKGARLVNTDMLLNAMQAAKSVRCN